MQINSSLCCPSLGAAGIAPERVDQTIEFLTCHADQAFKLHLSKSLRKEKKGESKTILYTLFPKYECFFNYIYSYPKDLHRFDKRYRADLKINEIDLNQLEEPLASFLGDILSRVKDVFSNFLHWKIDLRFERGMSYTQGVENFHRDAFSASVTVCYTNVEGWTTKIVNPKHYSDLNISSKIIGRPDFFTELQEKLKELEETSLPGELQNVNEIIHRAPTSEDLPKELSPDDYRLFLRFTSEHARYR